MSVSAVAMCQVCKRCWRASSWLTLAGRPVCSAECFHRAMDRREVIRDGQEEGQG